MTGVTLFLIILSAMCFVLGMVVQMVISQMAADPLVVEEVQRISKLISNGKRGKK